MARILIVGCGCRGRSLSVELRRDGHIVRGTTRDRGRLTEIEAAGAEAVLADPDRVSTLSRALEHVTVAFILLGSATGPDEHLAALHGTRLEMLLTRMLDTTVRGVVYEAAGTVDHTVLHAGAQRVRAACESSLIPYVLLHSDPTAGAGEWLAAASGAAAELLGRQQ